MRRHRTSHAPLALLLAAACPAAAEPFLELGPFTVPPLPASAGPDEVEKFQELGVLDLSGAAMITVTAGGRLGAGAAGRGPLELVLLPDVALARDVLRDDKVLVMERRIALPLQVEPSAPLFQARADPVRVAFPRHAAWLRNSTGVELTVTLFVLATPD